MLEPNNTDVVILCGGLGTRFNSVYSDRPKSLAPINDKVFLDYLIEHLIEVGFKRIILCLGHFHEQVVEHCQKYSFVDLIFSIEDNPLGTAGAIKNAEQHIKSQDFLVLNGDSFCLVDYFQLLTQHSLIGNEASIVISLDSERSDAGNIVYENDSKRVLSFNEKNSDKEIWINSGIYVLSKNLLKTMIHGKNLSLEYDIFPSLATNNQLFAIPGGDVFDIGTPKRYNDIINKSIFQSTKS
jgi:D-glycero-alpha-D-manno-heptose 1-phosphate guanylyltransferase